MENPIAKNVGYEAKSDESQWQILKENIIISEGTGTKDNPLILEIDSQTLSLSNL